MTTQGREATQGQASGRPKKPAPERTAPIRAWNGFAPSGAPPARETGPVEGESTGEPTKGGAAGGVASGYRVIDDYLSEGREAAARFGLGLASGGLGAGSSFQALTARLFQDGLLWLEHLSKLAAVQGPEAGEGAQGARHREPEQGRVRVRVASRRPAEVDLRLDPPASPGSYGVHPLRSPDPAAPAIDDVRLENRGGHWLLSVYVEEEQPDGLYTGVVFDRRDGGVQGTLAVRVGGEETGV